METPTACYVKQTGLFSLLDKNVLEKIAKMSLIHKLMRKKGEMHEFPLEGKVYIIHEGLVFLSFIDKNGKKVVLDILSPGSIFGDLDFTEDSSYIDDSLFIEPFKSANVCEMSKNEFKKIVTNNPEFALNLLSNLSKKLTTLGQKAGTLITSSVEARLIAQILQLGQEHGTEEKDKVRLNIKVTHEKLAEMVGAARETVSDTLSDLKKRRIISQDKSGKIILHKKKLDTLI